MVTLFDPIAVGSLELPNRIWMAPLTRGRATREGVPTDLMVDYYVQRSSAGLIISEATGISREGLGWPYAPGLWSDSQVEGWKKVTGAVHEAGGRIVAQLWHMGRLAHPSVSGVQPVSSSATTAPGHAHTYAGNLPYAEARPASTADIARIVGDYGKAARNAMAAGFDGVQLHGANGYLIDQFLRNGANFRDDDYGGPIANRIRLMSEAVAAVVSEAGADRTAIRLSPIGEIFGVDDSDPEPLFTAAAAELARLGIAWLELREPGPQSTVRPTSLPPVSPAIRRAFSGALVLNSDFDAASAADCLAKGRADAITFGRLFIANPDLPERLRSGAPLNQPDVKTFYTQGAQGYIDYPPLRRSAA